MTRVAPRDENIARGRDNSPLDVLSITRIIIIRRAGGNPPRVQFLCLDLERIDTLGETADRRARRPVKVSDSPLKRHIEENARTSGERSFDTTLADSTRAEYRPPLAFVIADRTRMRACVPLLATTSAIRARVP